MMLMMDKSDYSKVELRTLSVLSGGHGRMMTALLDMRIVLRREVWHLCTHVMIVLKLRGEELWALYHDVCEGDGRRYARYLYAISTGAAPVGVVRQGLWALTNGADVQPEDLRLRPYAGIPAPWMQPWIDVGRAYFGPGWRWEGL